MFITLVGLGIFYHQRFFKQNSDSLSTYQKSIFYISFLLLILLFVTPFHLIAKQYLFSAHMLQLALLYFVIVPLLIVSLPANFLKRLSWNYRFRMIMKIAGHPWLSLIIFNILFTVYFVPSVFNTVHPSFGLFTLFHLLLLLYAFFMWWAILGPVKRINEMKPLTKIFFIFLASMALMPIGFYHLLVLSPRYVPYFATEAKFLPVLTNVYDQQLAGGILKLIQLASFIFVMYRIVKAWAIQMQEKDGDPLNDNVRFVQGIMIRTNHEKK